MTLKTPFRLLVAALAAILALSSLSAQPSAPSTPQRVEATGRSITLSWTDNSSDETAFRVYRSASQNGIFVEVAEVGANTTQATVDYLASSTDYWFQVTALNSDGESSPSATLAASTNEAPPSGTTWVWWEGESYTATTTPAASNWLNPSSDAERSVNSSGNGFGYSTTEDEQNNGFSYVIDYDLEIPSAGYYQFYVRKPWSYSWFGWKLKGEEESALIIVDGDNSKLEDVEYKPNFPLSWVEMGSREMPRGSVTLEIHLNNTLFEPDDRGGAGLTQFYYDAFLATRTPFAPNGKRKPEAFFGLAEPGKWAFEPEAEVFSSQSLLDLRYLNEDLAGQSGFITREGHRFYRGDGQHIRFAGVNLGFNNSSYETMRHHAEFLAKRGVNLVRYHTSVYDNSADTMSYVDPLARDVLHRTVAAYRESGIYTKSSHFFSLGLRIQPEWGIDGYTASWTSSHDRAPFGNIFWDEDMSNAFKDWMRELYTTTNPYTGVPLVNDPALAIVEIQNEDNMFFWTLDLNQIPPEQLTKLRQKFYAFVVEKHESMDNAHSAWGGSASRNGDDLGNQELQVAGAYDLGYSFLNPGPSRERMVDLVEFYARLQRNWYADIRAFMEDEIGIQCTFTASNWRTSNDERLLDIERWTYTAAGVIDLHNYFDSPIDLVDPNQRFTVSLGDKFNPVAGVYNPHLISSAYEQVTGHPSFISELTWVNPNNYGAEGPMMFAAVASMNDVDGFSWFSMPPSTFSSTLPKWPLATPTILGQFPGIALLYRRGDVATAPVVVKEGRSLQSMWDREPSIITQLAGFDPTRDSDTGAPSSQSEVDLWSYVVGKVEVDVTSDDDTDLIRQDLLDQYIDHGTGTVQSATEELFWDTQAGIFTLDTDRAQGTAGFLGNYGQVQLSDLSVDSKNEFASVLAISLDDKPLSESERILIQSGTDDKPYGWTTTPASWTDESNTTHQGFEITNMGTPPLNVTTTDCTILLHNVTSAQSAEIQILDINGMPIGQPRHQLTEAGLEIVLPRHALYTHVTLHRPDSFFSGFYEMGGGWFYDTRLGLLKDVGEPGGWIYHADHGYLFLGSHNPANFWAYHPDLGWIYHGVHFYPWMWQSSTAEWIYYLEDSNRWFYSQSRGWFNLPRP